MLAQVPKGRQPAVHAAKGPARGPQGVPRDYAPRAKKDLAVECQGGDLERSDAKGGAVDVGRLGAGGYADCVEPAKRQVEGAVVREAWAVRLMIQVKSASARALTHHFYARVDTDTDTDVL